MVVTARTRNAVVPKGARGFESHLLRHKPAQERVLCGFSFTLFDAQFCTVLLFDANDAHIFDARIFFAQAAAQGRFVF